MSPDYSETRSLTKRIRGRVPVLYASAIEPCFTMERIGKSCAHNNNPKNYLCIQSQIASNHNIPSAQLKIHFYVPCTDAKGWTRLTRKHYSLNSWNNVLNPTYPMET